MDFKPLRDAQSSQTIRESDKIYPQGSPTDPRGVRGAIGNQRGSFGSSAEFVGESGSKSLRTPRELYTCNRAENKTKNKNLSKEGKKQPATPDWSRRDAGVA